MSTNYYTEDGDHIGKKSSAWSFCFCDREEYKTWQDVVDFIDSHQIFDEYGAPVTHEYFWSLVNESKDMRHVDIASMPTFLQDTVRKIDGHDFMDGEWC